VIEWKCPKCGATAGGHGKGGRYECADGVGRDCRGFLCECEEESGDDHGYSHADPCPCARCYHCGWEGTYPVPLQGILPWERKALAAGWTPPTGWEDTKKNGGKAK
jgi:hypothetical protein